MSPVEGTVQVTGSVGDVVEVRGFTMTRVRMCCGKSRYSVTGTLPAGHLLALADANGTVHAADYNASASSRPTRLARVLSPDHDLVLTVIPDVDRRGGR